MRKLICLLVLVSLSGLLLAQQPASPKPAAITREVLEKRLAELQQGREQALANVHAFDGALAECQHWLNELAPAEKPPEVKAGKPPDSPEKPR